MPSSLDSNIQNENRKIKEGQQLNASLITRAEYMRLRSLIDHIFIMDDYLVEHKTLCSVVWLSMVENGVG